MNIFFDIKDKIKDVYVKFNKKDFLEKTNVLSFICLCLFLLDCSVTGGGRYFEISGLSIRIIMGGLSILFSIPTLLKKWKENIINPINIMFLIFIFWFIICAVRGIVNENNYVTLISDIKGFMYLFLIPISLNCITSRERAKIIMDVVLIGAFLQSIIVLIINVYCAIDIDNLMNIYYWVMDIQLGTVSVISHSIYRIFMRSAPYVIVACVIAIYRQLQGNKTKVIYSFLTAFYLNALLLSYTRSLYGSAVISAIVVILIAILVYPKRVKILVKHLAVALLCTVILIGTEEIVFEASYLNFAVSRTLGMEPKASFTAKLQGNVAKLLKEWFYVDASDTTDESSRLEEEIHAQEVYLEMTVESDKIREVTQNELIELFKERPIIGNGLGASSATRNGPDEYFYLDMLARMGIVGMCLYMLPYLYIILKVLKSKSILLAVCICLPFWIATVFNPWMNAAVGISCYAISLAIAERNEVQV